MAQSLCACSRKNVPTSQYHKKTLLLVIPNTPVEFAQSQIHLVVPPSLLKTPLAKDVNIKATGTQTDWVSLPSENDNLLGTQSTPSQATRQRSKGHRVDTGDDYDP